MTIAEIIRFYNPRTFTPYSAFVVQCLPARRTTASYLTDIFGMEADNSSENIFIASLLTQPNTIYSSVTSIADCQAQSLSFYFDSTNQMLYIHVPTDILPVNTNYFAGKSFGYTKSDSIYIDGISYDPLIRSIPSLAQQADLQQYGQLAFVSGDITMDNTVGDFDEIIDSDIYGNDILLYELDEHEGDYTRSELIPLVAFYIEDYDFTLSDFTIRVQDKRKSQNIDLLEEFLDGSDTPVPLVYGQIRSMKAIVIDDTTIAPRFRVATYLSDIGIVECEGDFGWSAVAPINVDLATGSFNISATYARSPGNGLGEDTGSVLPVRVRTAIGYPNDSALDVIRNINQRVLGIEYTASNYDIDEWEAASAIIAPVGIVFDKQQEIFKAIQQIQAGCNLPFRYEINPSGLRTVRIDDWERATDHHVGWVDIKDNLTLPVSSDSTLLAAKVVVNYDKDYYENVQSSYTDDSLYDAVYAKYRQAPTMVVPTHVLTEVHAMQRAAYEASRFSTIPRVVNILLHGSQWYGVRIYDILEVEMKPEGNRQYFGTWKAQVLSVDPKLGQLYNPVTAVLIEKVS